MMNQHRTRNRSNNYDYSVNSIILGDSGVGKTSFARYLTSETFSPQHEMTIGVDFAMTYHDYKPSNTDDVVKFKFQLWDTAGQEVFKSITRSYYKQRGFAIIMFDLTDRVTFNACANWLRDLRSFNTNKNLSIVLVGNKLDQNVHRVVSTNEARNWAEENGMHYVEISVKKSENIEKILEIACSDIHKILTDETINTYDWINLGIRPFNVSFNNTVNVYNNNETRWLKILSCGLLG